MEAIFIPEAASARRESERFKQRRISPFSMFR
jgi:hypothetical protein